MRCIECSRVTASSKAHAKVGLGHCAGAPSSVFVTLRFERKCERFMPATEEQVIARLAWAAKAL